MTLRSTGAMPDLRVLHSLADELDVDLGTPDVATVRRELEDLGRHTGGRPAAPTVEAEQQRSPGEGEAVLATWHWLLDRGSLQDGEPHLAGTAKSPRLHLSAGTAAGIGAQPGQPVTVATDRGSLTLPLVLADLPDGVVWVPTNSPGSAVRRQLGALAGQVVRIAAGGTS